MLLPLAMLNMLICFDYITKDFLVQMIFGFKKREYVSISRKN